MPLSPKAPKPLVASSAMHVAAAVVTHPETSKPAALGMIGIGAIILKTPMGLRIIKLRPTGGAFASGKVRSLPPTSSLPRASLAFQVRVGDIILEVEGFSSTANAVFISHLDIRRSACHNGSRSALSHHWNSGH